MMASRHVTFLLLFLMLPQVMAGSPSNLQFTLHKLESGVPGPTILVIGGIQGDEPGGFTAASLLVTDYTITRGSVWVVPNLNFPSIIKRSRGIYGDMNRKFSNLHRDDPEYEEVQKIKSIILDDRIDLILNLHDGSGFYTPEYINKWRNPGRWGQSVIIDQENINVSRFGRLGTIAKRVVARVNPHIDRRYHYYVKNTKTREGDKEMEKTLTYFAIQNNKPAFGVEASKNFLTHQRSYYHLRVLEAFMQDTGIDFQRPFPLTVSRVRQRIDNNVQLSLFDQKLFFDMANARHYLSYIPFKKDAPLEAMASNPLVAVISEKSHYKVRYGNRHVTFLRPQYFEYDDSLPSVPMHIDGKPVEIGFGQIIDVNDDFRVDTPAEYRANIIGYYRKGLKNEAGLNIARKDILKRFSVDKAARIFRVEIYREGRFCGMVLVRFSDEAMAGSHVRHDSEQTHFEVAAGEGSS